MLVKQAPSVAAEFLVGTITETRDIPLLTRPERRQTQALPPWQSCRTRATRSSGVLQKRVGRRGLNRWSIESWRQPENPAEGESPILTTHAELNHAVQERHTRSLVFH